MNASTTEETGEIRAIGAKHGFSEEATRVMASAVAAGRGSQAQFDHPEFGGMGQWSSGGMTMIGDMFNATLKDRVAALASELSRNVGDATSGHGDAPARGGSSISTPTSWWPEELGRPSSSGGQNGQLYAVFPDRARLAVQRDGKVTVFDTRDYRIGGASQQQGSTSSLTFSTQNGSIDLDDLKKVGAEPDQAKEGAGDRGAGDSSDAHGRANDIPAKIRQLAELRDDGHLTQAEFDARKSKLLDSL
ncbi:SHOCT domain-containing protein [Aureimonas psammosilenae]|uniref:SHOCT domain-containing protein n=1 Tax=Aureimonas psammosilenae TaxID=2495496 RepID=UPI0012612506|nr:SHOCT domain-containing protein [Aureimonas psammosilenae]